MQDLTEEVRFREKVCLFRVDSVAGGFGLSAERVLHMYTALDENEWPIYVKAFEKATGIKVAVVRLSSGELLARVEAESKNPRASIWFGGPAWIKSLPKRKDCLPPTNQL